MRSYKCISLWKFKQVINGCWQRRDGARGTRVMFFVGDEEYELDRVGQFSVVPDVTIVLKPKGGNQ